ncbi:MAG: hypothetical protein R3E79_61720 [Caldilineaceae bacterium]
MHVHNFYLTKEVLLYFMKWHNVFMVGLLTVGLGFVSACSSLFGSDATDTAVASGNSREVVTFDVLMNDSYYGYSDSNIISPPVWTVPRDVDIVMNFDNKGKLKHNWAIVKTGVTIPVPFEYEQNPDILLYDAGMLYSNSKSTITIVAPEVGTYQVICTVSGHYPFMQGKLVVVEQ